MRPIFSRVVFILKVSTEHDTLGRFRFRSGDWEVEYEGEDADKKYEELLDWAKGRKTVRIPAKESEAPEEDGKAATVSRNTQNQSVAELELPKTGKLGILEFTESEVRFPSSAISALNIGEAAGLLLYEVGKPLKKTEIDFLLNRGFKRVRSDVVKNVLTAKKYPSARMVIRERDRYRLTGEGEAWVKGNVAPKIQAKSGSALKPS